MLYQLGRLPAPDYRDGRFLMSAVLDTVDTHIATVTTRKSWATGKVLDQGPTGSCVGHAWRQFLATAPIRTTRKEPSAMTIYNEAQLIDEWLGSETVEPIYEGTSVRAGAKVLLARGFIEKYLWAFDSESVARWILARGTVVAGTNWYTSMFEPDSSNFIRIGGIVEGGHAYLIYGVDVKKRFFRILNSWGPSFGNNGKALVSFDDMERLIRESGECCTTDQVVLR